MKKYFLIIFVMVMSLSLTGVVFADDDEMKMEKIVSNYEELAYVFRPISNEALLEESIDFCEGAGFANIQYGGQDFYSIETRGKDGSVVNWHAKKIGEGIGCSGDYGDPNIGEFQFYERWQFGKKNPITLIVWGYGRGMGADVPEGGIYPYAGVGWVIEAPPEYVGGYIALNGLLSLEPGLVAELGYEPASIITLRIFKERDAPGLFED